MCLPVAHGVAINDSKTTPQEESNIKMLPPSEPVNRFLGFHLDLSLQVEVLTVTASRRKMIPMASSSLAHRLSPENLNTALWPCKDFAWPPRPTISSGTTSSTTSGGCVRNYYAWPLLLLSWSTIAQTVRPDTNLTETSSLNSFSHHLFKKLRFPKFCVYTHASISRVFTVEDANRSSLCPSRFSNFSATTRLLLIGLYS